MKIKNNKNIDIITVFFSVYAIILGILLFCRPVRYSGMTYGEMLAVNYNFKLFDTIEYYFRVLASSAGEYLKSNAVINLAGNIFMFTPIGLYLPYKFKKTGFFPLFVAIVTAVICCVELLQFVTLLGYCDIDDLLLNLLGAVIGFIIYKVLVFFRK